MADLDTSWIGDNSFDPRAAGDALSQRLQQQVLPQQQPTLDQQTLNARLMRKLWEEPKRPGRIDYGQKEKPIQFNPADTPASAEPTEGTGDIQFNPADTPVEAEKKPEAPSTVGDYLTEFGKATARGAKDFAAGALQGAAAPTSDPLLLPDVAKESLAKPFDKFFGRETPDKPVPPAPPITQTPLWQAGAAMEKYGNDALAPKPGWEKSWTVDLGQGAGSMIAGIPLSMIPGVGPLVAGTVWTASGMGEAAQKAVENKATEEQIREAARWGGVAGATDMVDALLPTLGKPGAALGFIKRVGLAAVKGALMEGGQEAVQQLIQNAIAKGIYKPDQDMMEDVPRSFAVAAVLGGFVGAGSGALHKEAAPAQPAPSGPVPPSAGALPGGAGPAPGGAPGAAPGTTENVDTEEFLRRAAAAPGAPPAGGPAPGPAPGPVDPATMNDRELADAFHQARTDMGDKSLEEILRAGGYAPDTIKQMDERAKVEEAIGISRAYKAEEAQKTAPPGAEKPAEAAKPSPDQPSHADYATLREYGYSDEDIANMPPTQRSREVLDAKANGIDATKAMAKHPMPAAPAAPTGAPVDRGGFAGKREEPIKPQTAEDVKTAQPAEPKSPEQAQAENYQHAHMELPQFGLTGRKSVSIETGVGQTRKGVDADGKPWSVEMKGVAYGRLKGTKGADGAPLDIIVGPNPASPHIFVVDQHDPKTGKFDEHKILAGFDNPQDAIRAYAGVYTDQADKRIGHMVAMGPAEFETWRSGDTTKPLKPAPSEPATVGEGAGQKGSPEPVGGKTGGPEAAVTGESAQAEPTAPVEIGDAVAKVEQALGPDVDTVLPVDIHRAGEIMTDNPGMDPATAFGQAVVETAVEQGYLTEPEAEEIYGPGVQRILEAGRAGPPEGGGEDQHQGAKAEEAAPAGGEKAGVTTGGGKVERGEPAAEGHRPDDTAGVEPDTEREAADHAVQEAAAAAEAADNADIADREKGKKKEPEPYPTDLAKTVPEFIAAIEQRIAKGDYDAGIAPTKSLKAFKAAAEERGWFEAPFGKGKALWSKDREHYMLAWAPVEGNNLNVQWGEPGEVKKPLTEQETKQAAEEKAKQQAEAVAAKEEEAAKPKIEDVGEKIGGARKDTWKTKGLSLADLEGMTGAEREKHFTKHNIFERPDYVQMVADGTDPVAAALVKRIYDRMPVKPNTAYPDADTPKNFIDVLHAVRDAVKDVKTIDDVRLVARAVEGKVGYRYTQLIYPKNSSQNPLMIDRADVRSAERAVAAGFPEMAAWTRLFEVRQSYAVADSWIALRKTGERVGEFKTREEAEAAAKAAYEKLSAERKEGAEEPRRPHLDEVYRDGPDYRKDRDITGDDLMKDFGFRGVEFGNWVAGDERQKVVNLAYDALHDLARVLGISPKAISLDGTLAIGFGSRGRGGKNAGAAHYEADRTVINMTKINGAGSAAHEWAHALDHYLGESHSDAPYASAVKSVSGWDTTPREPQSHWWGSDYQWANRSLPLKLRAAVNRLMHDMFAVTEDDTAAVKRAQDELENAKRNLEGWQKQLDRVRARRARGEGGKGEKQAIDQVAIWGRNVAKREKALTEGIAKKTVPSDYVTEATKLSGTGNYWRRPNELWARSFETFIFDKLKAEGHESQYLVQGVEPNRFGNGFRGNPYPVGHERTRLNADWERVLRGIVAEDGAKGRASKLTGAQGEPEPVEHVSTIARPKQQEPMTQEIAAVEAGSTKTLPGAFEGHFKSGKGFDNIVEARRFAKDAGYDVDPKAVEEAIELAVVKTARSIVEANREPATIYAKLVDLYKRQPRLGTRTSTSVRDQAYSTPVPLAYIAAELAHIHHGTTVYEPTAGNGALLITANPENVHANELNPERAANLQSQGFTVSQLDAATGQPREQLDLEGLDRVIANPPFGPVKEDGVTKIYDLKGVSEGVSYQTGEVDHAIAMEALDNMKDDGRAVLIIGGINKLVTGTKDRADAYNGKSKREFFKALMDQYNVVDMFTVSGDLYARQGAGWPVDVIVINGRMKSKLPLPAVSPPRIYSDWESLGGLLSGQPSTSYVQPTGGEAAGAAGGGVGLEGGRGRGGEPAGPVDTGPIEPEGVRGEPVGEAGPAGEGGGQPRDVTEGAERGGRPGRAGEQPATVSREELSDLFDEILAESETPAAKPTTTPRPPRPRTEKPTPEIVREAGEHISEAADKAMKGLTELFGGGKTFGAGPAFDEETYAKAKPFFKTAIEEFGEFAADVRELMRRLVDRLRRLYKWTNENIAKAKEYITQFILDVQSGDIKLGVEEAPKPTEAQTAEALKSAATETENQVAYQKRSSVPGLDTLAPVNMAKPMSDSLMALETRVGDIDKFVGNELGMNVKQLPTYFSAEQVDALGLAIDNIKNGKGFIIGDQTGIGKGRVNAAIIRWAIKNGRVPVFVTEKPNLYKDMYRDLDETGMPDFLDRKPRILATNAALKLPLEEGAGAAINTGDATQHNKHLMDVLGDFGAKYDMVFTTYNQMQTQEGKETPRRAFLSQLADRPNGIVMIFDESHNAGGQTVTRKAKGDAPGRAQFSRDLIQKANGVFYSSATYAKRPEVMDLYAATDMAMAVDDIGDLAEAIARGGVPMQQAVASMLARAGQYMRRERSFAGINYNTPSVPVDRNTYDGVARALSQIQDLSKYTARGAAKLDDEVRAEAGAVTGDGSTGAAGASSTNFTSVMHNVVNQMLLAFKADHAANHAIEAIKSGEKPVLTVANTMEAFLEDYSDAMDLKPGDAVEGDFSHVLKKYLDRTRTVLIKKAHMAKGEKPIRHYLTDGELGKDGVAVYQRALDTIEALDLAGLPISPIDYIKGRIKKAGYDTGEITGRTLMVDYTGKVPVLAKRPGSDKTAGGKSKTIKAFNTRPSKGGTQAMIINQSGSTGLSLHAHFKFDDQAKRRMIVVQPEANIDTHMQLLGRVNRTGQVVLPEYDQLVLDAPAEKRPAAVLAKKMASLNANTTASRGSAVTAKDVPDFINQYGDEIAAGWVRDNMEEHFKLASPIGISDEGKVDSKDAMRKLTGRIPLLPLERQEEIYNQLEGEYAALIAQLDASGENALEAKSADLKAKLLERTEVQGKRNDSGSPFAAPVVMQKVSVARIGKPYTPAEVMKKVENAVTGAYRELPPAALPDMLKDFNSPYSILGKQSAAIELEERRDELKRFETYTRGILEEIEKPEDQAKEQTKYNANKDRWTSIHQMVPIGRRVVIKTETNNLTGVVIDVKQQGSPKNPLALGSWKVTFAIADPSRQMIIPFSRLYENGQSNPESVLDVEIEPMTEWREPFKETLDKFQHMQTEAREERYIAGGNMLAAYDWLERKGTILNYTSDRGTVHQGIMTARGFDLGKHAIAHGNTTREPAVLKQALDAPPYDRMWSKDGNVALQKDGKYGRNYIITTQKAKNKAGQFFTSRELTAQMTGDFVTKGGYYVGYIPEAKFDDAFRTLLKLGAEFKVAAERPKAQPFAPGEEPTLASIGRPALPEWTAEEVQEITDAVKAFVAHRLGDTVAVRFLEGPVPHSPQSAADWGGVGTHAIAEFRPWQRVVATSLRPDIGRLMAHEVYHAIEELVMSDEERAVMNRETEKLRDLIKPYAGEVYGMSPNQVDAIADYEVRAIRDEMYSRDRHAREQAARAAKQPDGLHPIVRRVFDKIRQFLRDLGAALRRALSPETIEKIVTADDIYSKIYEGGFRNAPLNPTEMAVRPEGYVAPTYQEEIAKAKEEGIHRPSVGPQQPADLIMDRLLRDFMKPPAPREATTPGPPLPARPGEEPKRAATGPAGRQGPPRMPETIEAQLRARGQLKLANLAGKTGIGKLNTVEVRTKIQDRFIRILNAEKSVQNYNTALSAYQAESLMHGRTGERLEDLERRRFDPIIEEMHRADIDLGEMNAYLYARHAPERNAYIDRINPNLGNEGSGMSDQDAADIINAIDPRKLPDYVRIANMVDAINAETRANLVAYGLISQETADAWDAQYRYYVPLRGFEEASENDEPTPGYGIGIDQRAKVTKQAFGRKSIADGPLQYVFMQAESAILRGEKNRVGNTYLRFIRQNPDPARWQINAPTLKRRIDPQTGMVTYYADFNYHNEPDAFVTRVGGKPMVIRHYGRDGLNIARALKNMEATPMNAVMRGLQMLTTVQARLNTQWNPEFVIPNMARDVGEAFINMGEQDQRRFVTQFAKHLGPSLKGIMGALREPGTGGGRYGAAFREFDKAGGRIRFFGLDDPTDIARNVNRKMRKLEGGVFNNLMSAAAAAGEAIEMVNNAVENSTRLAAYMAARDVGKSIPDSAMLARNMTVDFNKKGEWGPIISALYMFGGARLQGTARLGRALQHKRVRQLAYGLAGLGALSALFSMLAGGDDDDGESFYGKIPSWVRDKNMIIMWPKGWGHDGAYIKIPVPFGFAPFFVLGARATAVATGTDKVTAAGQAFLASVADAFNPAGEESNILMQLVPSLLRPGLHIWANQNWTGRPIYPDRDYNKQAPDSTKAFRSTSGFSKWVAETANSVTGGDKYKAGWIDVHPGSIDHVIENVTGGVGRFASGLVKVGANALNGEFDPAKTPVLRRFYGEAKDPQADAAAYYKAREEAEKAGGVNLRQARKDMATPALREGAEAYIQGHPKAGQADAIFKGAETQMKPLRQLRDRAESDGNREEVKRVEERIRQIQNMARKRYKELQATP